jgi:hypothetical protein
MPAFRTVRTAEKKAKFQGLLADTGNVSAAPREGVEEPLFHGPATVFASLGDSHTDVVPRRRLETVCAFVPPVAWGIFPLILRWIKFLLTAELAENS